MEDSYRSYLESVVMRHVRERRPDWKGCELPPDANLAEHFGFDSVDSIELILDIEEELRIVVPREDYPSFRTLRSASEYLTRRLGRGG